MKKLLVVCASRDRPQEAQDMVRSVAATSEDADVAVYVDQDQAERYPTAGSGVRWLVGQRAGQCLSLNALVARFPGYLAYGAATDDCIFRTPGWDRWVVRESERFAGGVGVLAPHCQMERRMDFPWTTEGWIRHFGAFCWPLYLRHSYWDLALEVLGEAAGAIRYATPEQFSIFHAELEPGSGNGGDRDSSERVDTWMRVLHDARDFCWWYTHQRREEIARLRGAVDGIAVTPHAESVMEDRRWR